MTTIESDEDLLDEARTRYLTDPWFHACVDAAREVAQFKGGPMSERNLATITAAMALVLHEGGSGNDNPHESDGTPPEACTYCGDVWPCAGSQNGSDPSPERHK